MRPNFIYRVDCEPFIYLESPSSDKFPAWRERDLLRGVAPGGKPSKGALNHLQRTGRSERRDTPVPRPKTAAELLGTPPRPESAARQSLPRASSGPYRWIERRHINPEGEDIQDIEKRALDKSLSVDDFLKRRDRRFALRRLVSQYLFSLYREPLSCIPIGGSGKEDESSG